MAAFAAYCSNYSTWRQADAIIKDSGLVVKTFTTDKDGNILLETIKKHPAVAIRSDAFEKMKAFLIEFGFTPASRSRVHLPEEEKNTGKKKSVGGLLSR
jgi:P27 family predicted phage terminase small subunit